MSGIQVDDAIATLFNEMKLRSIHKWATFKIENKKKIVIDQVGDPVKTESFEEEVKYWQEFLEKLGLGANPAQARYGLYDFSTQKEGRKIEKLGFIFWCPDDVKVGDRMIYASSKDTVKKSFSGLSIELQFNDAGDADYQTVIDEVIRKA